MRWKHEPYEDHVKRKTTWTKWFAWRPVHCYDVLDKRDCVVWLEHVYRKYRWTATQDFGYWTSQYMTPEEYNRLQNVFK